MRNPGIKLTKTQRNKSSNLRVALRNIAQEVQAYAQQVKDDKSQNH